MAKLVRCKLCDKEISNEVKLCPNCGHRQNNRWLASSFQMSKIIYALLFMIIVVTLLNKCSNTTSTGIIENNVVSDTITDKALEQQIAVQVNVIQLYNDYKRNEISADNKYRNKKLIITGMIGSINRGIGDDYYITLIANNEYQDIRANFKVGYKDYLSKLQKFQNIKLSCVGDGMLIGSPILRDCTPYTENDTTLLQSESKPNINLEQHPLKTIYGTLTATKNSNYGKDFDGMDIFLDNNKIMSSYRDLVVYQIQILDHLLIVIETDEGGNSNIASYRIIDIKPDKSFIVQDVEKGEFGHWTEFLQSGKCVIANTDDSRPYADKSDYRLFKYCIDSGANLFNEYQFAKPNLYYSNKFSNYTSKQIYDLAVADGCFLTATKQIDMSRVCDFGEKYCFMFKSKNTKEHNDYSQILENSCKY